MPSISSCEFLFAENNNDHQTGRLNSGDLNQLRRGQWLRLYMKDLIIGGVEILRTSEDLIHSRPEFILELHQLGSFDLPVVLILKNGTYISGSIAAGNFVLPSLDGNPNSGTVSIFGYPPVQIGQIQAFGKPVRDVSSIEQVINNSPKPDEKSSFGKFYANQKRLAETFKGLSIAESNAYHNLLALKPGDRVDLFPKDAVYSGATPRDSRFVKLEEKTGAGGKREIFAVFTVEHLIGSSSSEIVKISLRDFAEKNTLLLPFNPNPNTRATAAEQRLIRAAKELRKQGDGIIWFDPGYRIEFRPPVRGRRIALTSLEIFQSEGYYWIKYQTQDGNTETALLRSVANIEVELPITP